MNKKDVAIELLKEFDKRADEEISLSNNVILSVIERIKEQVEALSSEDYEIDKKIEEIEKLLSIAKGEKKHIVEIQRARDILLEIKFAI